MLVPLGRTPSPTTACCCPACTAPGATPPALSRRTLFAAAAAVAVATAAGRPARAQTTLSPEAALKELMDGNARYVAGRPTAPEHDLALLHAKNVEKQEPFAAVLACADSRVPVELVFDQTIGHLFVTRVAGNIASPEIIASLEYGAAVLGTKAILVLGHQGCGAVKAAIEGKPAPGQISALYAPLRPAVDQAGHDLDAAVKANARIQARLLREASPVLAGLAAQSKLKIVAGYYAVADGKVTLLD